MEREVPDPRRDNYIIVEALSFTIEALSGLPIEHRPDNNIADMKRILDEFIIRDSNLALHQGIARRRFKACSPTPGGQRNSH